MSRISKAISEELVLNCKESLKQQGVRGEIGRRLQAILSAKEHGITKVSEVYNITRQTLMDWIKAYKNEGVSGFKVKAGRGRKAIINEEQREVLREYVLKEGARLTCKKLKIEIDKRYGIDISLRSTFRLMHKLGFSHITARPVHHKQDKATHEEFKKKSTK